ncbi:hypothetical protein [Rufibacter quisquiliarum]|uniref:Uncharacterized protein n=1 Tax=Rufibacter quisquiliarum TaxID=1549639 RepID=A0A839GXA8_9BACT|nr:hypothetical protein [Rufibacter quisquiliarum]MBA9079068.1 hypothetical protein [Rufibacter quisquiliarum]
MKSYLLLGISVLLLLFTLPNPHQAVNRWVSPETSVLREAGNHKKHTARRTCKKKCLRHQTHSSSNNSAGTLTDCSTPIYALIAALLQMPVHHLSPGAKIKGNLLAVVYFPPPLEREPNPPRIS